MQRSTALTASTSVAADQRVGQYQHAIHSVRLIYLAIPKDSKLSQFLAKTVDTGIKNHTIKDATTCQEKVVQSKKPKKNGKKILQSHAPTSDATRLLCQITITIDIC